MVGCAGGVFMLGRRVPWLVLVAGLVGYLYSWGVSLSFKLYRIVLAVSVYLEIVLD